MSIAYGIVACRRPHQPRRAAEPVPVPGRVRDRRRLRSADWARYPPLGIAAAIGLVLYFVGAVGAHLRKSDFKGMPNAAVMLAGSGAALILGVISG